MEISPDFGWLGADGLHPIVGDVFWKGERSRYGKWSSYCKVMILCVGHNIIMLSPWSGSLFLCESAGCRYAVTVVVRMVVPAMLPKIVS